jgi:hypothetical protein
VPEFQALLAAQKSLLIELSAETTHSQPANFALFSVKIIAGCMPQSKAKIVNHFLYT